MYYYQIIGFASCSFCQRANSLLLQEKLPFVASWIENSPDRARENHLSGFIFPRTILDLVKYSEKLALMQSLLNRKTPKHNFKMPKI